MDSWPDCTCYDCTPDWWGMRLCSTCGNKRCPHATSCQNTCTGSNEPGQPGSAYPASPWADPDHDVVADIMEHKKRMEDEYLRGKDS